ncbi:hypothetical protein CXG81DRAFT_19345 [Caulochytrium protostelioides]|uniref:Uncharacterized protein n=1 Tax=Caulochytrium protostelioides TaxID=1555241 RepID=A0A4P9X6F2_9FUNG|nr:hypothetical protein CXG81DRAFT_19345 [Caulochytrium protostelioides]|eukprot:RKP00767.1 hypothetical protein CXG81DRAFT_19345 [Caulochytrium protostelioides]
MDTGRAARPAHPQWERPPFPSSRLARPRSASPPPPPPPAIPPASRHRSVPRSASPRRRPPAGSACLAAADRLRESVRVTETGHTFRPSSSPTRAMPPSPPRPPAALLPHVSFDSDVEGSEGAPWTRAVAAATSASRRVGREMTATTASDRAASPTRSDDAGRDAGRRGRSATRGTSTAGPSASIGASAGAARDTSESRTRRAASASSADAQAMVDEIRRALAAQQAERPSRGRSRSPARVDAAVGTSATAPSVQALAQQRFATFVEQVQAAFAKQAKYHTGDKNLLLMLDEAQLRADLVQDAYRAMCDEMETLIARHAADKETRRTQYQQDLRRLQEALVTTADEAAEASRQSRVARRELDAQRQQASASAAQDNTTIAALKTTVAELTSERASLASQAQHQTQAHEQQLVALQRRVASHEADKTALHDALMQTQQQRDAHRATIGQLEGALESVRAELGTVRAASDERAQSLQRKTQQLADQQALLEEANQVLETFQLQETQTQQERRALEAARDRFRSEAQQRERDVARATAQLAASEQQQQQLREQLHAAQAQAQTRERDVAAVLKRVQDHEATEASLRTTLRESEAALAAANGAMGALEQAAARARDEARQWQRRHAQLEHDVARATQRADQLADQNAQLRDDLAVTAAQLQQSAQDHALAKTENAAHVRTISDRINELQAALEATHRQLARLRENEAQHASEAQHHESAMRAEQLRADNAVQQAAQWQRQLALERQDHDAYRAKKQHASQQLEDKFERAQAAMAAEVARLHAAADDLRTDVERLETENQQLHQKLADKQRLLSDVAQLTHQEQTQKQRIDALTDELLRKENEIALLHNQQQNMEHQLSRLEIEVGHYVSTTVESPRLLSRSVGAREPGHDRLSHSPPASRSPEPEPRPATAITTAPSAAASTNTRPTRDDRHETPLESHVQDLTLKLKSQVDELLARPLPLHASRARSPLSDTSSGSHPSRPAYIHAVLPDAAGDAGGRGGGLDDGFRPRRSGGRDVPRSVLASSSASSSSSSASAFSDAASADRFRGRERYRSPQGRNDDPYHESRSAILPSVTTDGSDHSFISGMEAF